MAVVETGPLVQSIRGSIGGTTFSKWKNKTVAKSKPISVEDPQSGKQDRQRNAVSEAAVSWNEEVSSSEKGEWGTLANQNLRGSEIQCGVRDMIPKNWKNLSGYNAFIMLNAILASVGTPAITKAPLGVRKKYPPADFAATWDEGTKAIIVTWTISPEWTISDKIRCWIRSVTNKFHFQIAFAVNARLATASITSVTGNDGSTVLLEDIRNSAVYLQAELILSTGIFSGATQTIELAIPSIPIPDSLVIDVCQAEVTAGDPFDPDPEVTVRDQDNNVLSGVSVTVEIVDNSTYLEDDTVETTDVDGIATFDNLTCAFGAIAGPYTIKFYCTNYPTVYAEQSITINQPL